MLTSLSLPSILLNYNPVLHLTAVNLKDYSTALQTHTMVAQSANFSEVGSFLPGLKVLLQVIVLLGNRWY